VPVDITVSPRIHLKPNLLAGGYGQFTYHFNYWGPTAPNRGYPCGGEENEESRVLIEQAFWMEFIIKERLIKPELVQSLLNEADELTVVFISPRKTIQIKRKMIINRKSQLINQMVS